MKMDYDYFDKFTFACEMYDEEYQLIELILNFFPRDNSIQIIDVAKGKNLVRRMHLPPLKLKMLQIGTIINILNRLIYIKDCAPLTMRTLFSNNERLIINYVTSGEVLGLELVGPDAVKWWRKCLGATDPAEAEPGTLRKIYGQDILHNVAHGSDTLEEATMILDEFFGIENGVPKTPYYATLKNCTCCIVMPHAVIDGNLGLIIEHVIIEGFRISAMGMVSVNDTASKEFFEVYKGVVQKFDNSKTKECLEIGRFVLVQRRFKVDKSVVKMEISKEKDNGQKCMERGTRANGHNVYIIGKEMCMHLTQGKCVVFEVKHKDPNVNPVCEFRKLCGPRDPDIGRQLYPDTIRARFGKDLVHNAVHCTDLPEDGEMESEYFFKLLVNEF